MDFKIGDIITCQSEFNRDFRWTTTDAIMRVVCEENKYGDILVEILSHRVYGTLVGNTYRVNQSKFIKFSNDVL